MAAHTTADIRNIALVGQSGAGKTTLVEALLHRAGAIAQPGSIARGSTVCDFDPQEKAHGHSLDSALAGFDHGGAHVNLIDTPGYPDLMGRALAVLPAVETCAVVINAQSGIEMLTRRMMDAARELGLDRIIIVNRIDADGVDLGRLLVQIRETFGPECLPINLPANRGGAVLDCFFQPAGGATDIGSVAEAHTAIIDQVVELDEQLMELYLEQGEELSPEQLHDPFERALREGHLVPVCFVSAVTGAGIEQLLEIFERLLPNPTEGNPPRFLKGAGESAQPIEIVPDASRHALAHVFKVSIDPFVGRLGVFRVHQGTITKDSQLFIGDGRKPFKVGHLLRLQGKEHAEIQRALPGDICAVAKVDDIQFDSVLHDSHDEDHLHLVSIRFPEPMHGIAIETRSRGDEQKISDALHKLCAEDPSLRVEHHASLNETVLRGLGELHLRIVLEKLKDRFNVEVDTRPPRIPYRETVTAQAEGHYRHKKQTGGAGQFGEVFLRVEPLPRGSGFEFVDEVVGGAIPRQFIPAVEKGIRQALASGPVGGFPVHDVRVCVHDGKFHTVDSKEVAFVTAGRKAFLEAFVAAKPVVLEPLVEAAITAPAGAIGDITADLSGRRGRINGTSVLADGRTTISALVPLAELDNYQSKLKSMTGGSGTFAVHFSHYDPVPARTQKDLADAYRPAADSD